MGFGLIIKQRKNSLSGGDLDQKGSIGIWSKKKIKASCICFDGYKVHDRENELYFPEGSVFNIIVDLVDSRIMWSNSMKEIETRITSRFLSTELYVYSVMYDKGSVMYDKRSEI